MSCLDLFVAAFDRLSEAIENWDACCQGQVDTLPPAADDITGVDDSGAAPAYDREADEHPVEYANSAEYDAYLCGVAHRVAGKTDGSVDAVYDTILIASNILVFATLLVLAFGNVIGMGVAAIIAGGYSLVSLSEVFGFFSAMTELREALGGGDPQGLVPQTKAQLTAAYDDIVDAIFCANDASEATVNLHAVYDANVTSTSYRTLLKLMMNELVVRAMFAGFVNVPDRFDCSCVDTGDWAFWQVRSSVAAPEDSVSTDGATVTYTFGVPPPSCQFDTRYAQILFVNDVADHDLTDVSFKVTIHGSNDDVAGRNCAGQYPYANKVARYRFGMHPDPNTIPAIGTSFTAWAPFTVPVGSWSVERFITNEDPGLQAGQTFALEIEVPSWGVALGEVNVTFEVQGLA